MSIDILLSRYETKHIIFHMDLQAVRSGLALELESGLA